MIEFKVSKCKDKAGYSAKPVKNLELDLWRVKKKFVTILETPLVIVVDCDGEIVVHKFGELLFKTLTDEKKINEIAKQIYAAGGLR